MKWPDHSEPNTFKDCYVVVKGEVMTNEQLNRMRASLEEEKIEMEDRIEIIKNDIKHVKAHQKRKHNRRKDSVCPACTYE